ARRPRQHRTRRRRPRRRPHGALARHGRAARGRAREHAMKALVLLPAFNEAARIGRVLGGIRAAAPEATVLVVDDGSADYRAGALRRTGMGVFGLLAWLLTGVRFSDVTSGFRAFGSDVVRFVATEWYPTDYADADVLITLRRAGFRLKEVPVRMYPRAGG